MLSKEIVKIEKGQLMYLIRLEIEKQNKELVASSPLYITDKQVKLEKELFNELTGKYK